MRPPIFTAKRAGTCEVCTKGYDIGAALTYRTVETGRIVVHLQCPRGVRWP